MTALRRRTRTLASLTELARIPADVSKRLVLPILALALVAAACSEPPAGEIDFGSGRQFVPEVADSSTTSASAPPSPRCRRRALRLLLGLPGRARRRPDPRRPSHRRPLHPDRVHRGQARRLRCRRRRRQRRAPTASSREAPPPRFGTRPPASRCPTDRPPSTSWSAPRRRTRTAPTSRSTSRAASTWSGPAPTGSGTPAAPTASPPTRSSTTASPPQGGPDRASQP